MTVHWQPDRYLVHTTMSLTLAAVMFTIAGALGWSFPKRVGAPYGHWTGTPIAWEVGVGVLAGIGAWMCWRLWLDSFDKP